MIKEHFTDGLISLAILLSLFRTDLTGINDLINYPEVQDIILGQTVAYLPTSFHHSPQTLINSRKHIDFDNDAFNAWFHNINNLPIFREQSQNHIEAFLVSASTGLPSEVVPEQFQTAQTANTQNPVNEEDLNVRNNTSSPTLPIESANSFSENSTTVSSDVSEVSTQHFDASTVVNVSCNFSNPFPGCNLTTEDLDLIDVLWRQDVDLGCGKEAFDQNLRLELEKERHLEALKEQEKIQAQRVAAEKEERERQELANRWLKENFMRDGETGEWIRLQNNNISNAGLLPVSPDHQLDDWTLEQALDYISANGGQEFVQSDTVKPVTDHHVHISEEDPLRVVPEQVHQVPELTQQDSLEENWNGLVGYLNMEHLENAELSVDEASPSMVRQELPVQEQFQLNETDPSQLVNGDCPQYVEAPVGQSPYEDNLDQSQFLLQNATMPTGADIANDLNVLTPLVTNMTSDFTPNPAESEMDWGGFTFFNNLTGLENAASSELDLVKSIFQDMSAESLPPEPGQVDLKEDMDTIQIFGADLNNSLSSSSPEQNVTEIFDGLEGATGGLELCYGDLDISQHNLDLSDGHRRFSKMSRLSESSSDSGLGQTLSSPDASPPTSSAASPTSSFSGNQTASNHTEHDPHGSHALVLPHIAHNHTYNTPPGQVPREVKKYAHKEPSRKGPQSRDAKRAMDMKLPFTVPEIINSPVEAYNDMLTKHKLSEAQLALIRDIRRRGKNKVAAQNCRKRKVGVIEELADEMGSLQKMRDRLLAERAEMEEETRRMKDKFSQMYANIFQSLRNEQGQPYDPNLYSLQQTSDGDVFLVPRNLDNNRNRTSTNSTVSSSTNKSSKDSKTDGSGSRKRKAYDH